MYTSMCVFIYIYIHTTGNSVLNTKNQLAPRETWILSSDLLLSCQFILREGEERELGLVTPMVTLCVLSDWIPHYHIK